MIDVELVKDCSLRIRKKYVASTNPLPQSPVNFRGGNTDGIDLNTIAVDGVIVFLELLQLHAAKGSPGTTIKEVEGTTFAH